MAATFGPLCEFFDVEGIPVTIAAGPQATPGMHCARWDGSHPQPYSAIDARHNGTPVTAEAFTALLPR